MKDGGSVFPIIPSMSEVESGSGYPYLERGISLRDHVAIEVLKELISKYDVAFRSTFEKELVQQAYKFADTVLEVRNIN